MGQKKVGYTFQKRGNCTQSYFWATLYYVWNTHQCLRQMLTFPTTLKISSCFASKGKALSFLHFLAHNSSSSSST